MSNPLKALNSLLDAWAKEKAIADSGKESAQLSKRISPAQPGLVREILRVGHAASFPVTAEQLIAQCLAELLPKPPLKRSRRGSK